MHCYVSFSSSFDILLNFAPFIYLLSLNYLNHQVEGSASYLDENVENQKTVRVTSKFNTKTKSYTLHPNQAPNAVMCGKKEATQVVSEVTYGFNSYFIFEKTVSNKTDIKKAEGKNIVLLLGYEYD